MRQPNPFSPPLSRVHNPLASSQDFSKPPLRKGWAYYLGAYIVGYFISVGSVLYSVGTIPPLGFLSGAIEAFAIYVLYRHVRRRPIPSVNVRLGLIVFSILYFLKFFAVFYLLFSNLFPWQAMSEQWVSLMGLGGLAFSGPMVVAVVLYSLGTQTRVPTFDLEDTPV